METRKKRKIGNPSASASPGASVMSAFALRQQLLKSQNSASSSPSETQGTTITKVNNIRDAANPDVVLVDSESAPETPASLVSSQVPSRASPEIAEVDESASSTRVIYFSSFKASKQNFQKKPHGISVLKLVEGERLVILGSYGLTVKNGLISVAGATLQARSGVTWIHSPHCHALPVIRCSEDAILELSSHPAASSLRDLGSLSPKFEKLWNDAAGEEPLNKPKASTRPSYTIIYTSEDGPKAAPLQELASLAEWNKKLASLAAASRSSESMTILVCGPKSSGKSTFGRLLANRLVTETNRRKDQPQPGVAILDIDPGQPEFGAPGVLSLVYVESPNLQPPFCHPCLSATGRSRIIRSHSIAAISPITNPDHYTECVLDLYATYATKLRRKCPLVINTCGWVQGTGLNIITELIGRIRPTEVVYMSKEGPEETVEALREACLRKMPLVFMPSQSSKYTARTAADLRMMQMMSYFHVDQLASAPEYLHWNTDPLASIMPWNVKYGGRDRAILGIICYDYEPTADMLAPLIDGMILAMVEIEDIAAFRDMSAAAGQLHGYEMDIDHDANDDSTKAYYNIPVVQTPEGLPFIQNQRGITLDPRHSRTVGLALVRAIDEKSQTLQLLTPVSEERITELNTGSNRIVFVWGRLDAAPTWSYVEERHRQDVQTRTKQFATDDVAAEESGPGRLGSIGDGLPWVEELQANQKRAAGHKALRVRRDLGRSAKGTD
ncbi:hypothetical protein MCOR25_001234 [Pyricularia grisea]|uniref:Polynucleotide 5'-hydroxyl-kinase GRC3 n=1 Tax=Pyricularia grisea TaxID=148305 RepID=A0A6P8BI14_PYRGI|nr:uncharacterized protein PgNI_00763 [Pyricularia grisea]KAI6381300.1 hypothetical protein MCOR25_001234 [Pyricularia grisea]TLD16521.1 hypothetical protein PgNI_00763 [Pyricularia grisea]